MNAEFNSKIRVASNSNGVRSRDFDNEHFFKQLIADWFIEEEIAKIIGSSNEFQALCADHGNEGGQWNRSELSEYYTAKMSRYKVLAELYELRNRSSVENIDFIFGRDMVVSVLNDELKEQILFKPRDIEDLYAMRQLAVDNGGVRVVRSVSLGVLSPFDGNPLVITDTLPHVDIDFKQNEKIIGIKSLPVEDLDWKSCGAINFAYYSRNSNGQKRYAAEYLLPYPLSNEDRIKVLGHPVHSETMGLVSRLGESFVGSGGFGNRRDYLEMMQVAEFFNQTKS